MLATLVVPSNAKEVPAKIIRQVKDILAKEHEDPEIKEFNLPG